MCSGCYNRFAPLAGQARAGMARPGRHRLAFVRLSVVGYFFVAKVGTRVHARARACVPFPRVCGQVRAGARVWLALVPFPASTG